MMAQRLAWNAAEFFTPLKATQDTPVSFPVHSCGMIGCRLQQPVGRA